MKTQVKRFLEFHGRNIYLSAKDGQYWVAIKPICLALGVDYEAQRKAVLRSRIFGQLPSTQTVVAADNKMRQMLCLPEKWIYGWLLSIDSDSEDLLAYQLECYDVLYNYFHGPMSERMQTLRGKSAAEIEVETLQGELEQSDTWQKLEVAKKKVKHEKERLAKLDRELLNYQTTLFNDHE